MHMSWELAATILGVAGIISGVLLKIFRPVKSNEIVELRNDVEGLNKKVNNNYNGQQLVDKGLENRVHSVENDIESMEEFITEINNDRKKDIEKFEAKLERINELILRLLQDK